ncbi:hypothetical protein PSPO01_06371 [Paraphaeosphaeria sporulosa]
MEIASASTSHKQVHALDSREESDESAPNNGFENFQCRPKTDIILTTSPSSTSTSSHHNACMQDTGRSPSLACPPLDQGNPPHVAAGSILSPFQELSHLHFSSSSITSTGVVPIPRAEKRYACSSTGCFASFVERRKLDGHAKSTHSRVYCKECPKTYAHRKNLLEHVQARHRGIWHTCNFESCTYATEKKANLVRHRNSLHKGL